MADISIKEAQAKQWVEDVNEEIASVKLILDKVATSSVAVPGEDDTVMKGIESTCKKLQESWTEMFDRFNQVAGKMQQLINLVVERARELAEEAQSIGHR